MKNWRSNLDEMQEQKLLKIEHNGCWGAFLGLFAALVVQTAMGAGFHEIAGEWLVFMALAVYLVGSCARAGIWDRYLKNNGKTNLLVSLAAGLVVAVMSFGRLYAGYGVLDAALWSAALGFISVFVLCFGALTLAGRYTKKRQEALEAEPEEEEAV